MTMYDLYLAEQIAERVELLLDDVLPVARDKGRECSFLLACSTLLLCQTNDRVFRQSESTQHAPPLNDGFKAACELKFSEGWEQPGHLLYVLRKECKWQWKRRLVVEEAHASRGPEEALGSAEPNAAKDMLVGTFFKHLRNGLAHGGVWWGYEPLKFGARTVKSSPSSQEIRLVFVRSLQEGKKPNELWQASGFSIAGLELTLRWWCALLKQHKTSVVDASGYLDKVA